jgi:hypothetical protein
MINSEFNRWFYDENYPLENSNRSQVFTANMNNNPTQDDRDYWMRQSFTAGYMKAIDDAALSAVDLDLDWNETQIDFDNYGPEENT